MTIAGLLLCAQLMTAQTPTNRTSKTIAVDVLALMPAQQQQQYNQLISDLKAGGEASVLTLVRQMDAPGKEGHAAVDYALSGLIHYVMAQGEEAARLTVANAYIKALDLVEEQETKAFLIRQLQLVGRDESVEPLSLYLTDEALSAPAAQALASIQSELAGQALKAALMKRRGTPQTQKNVIQALGDAETAGAEELLTVFLGSSDEELQKVTLYALSRVGTDASLKPLAEAAAAVGYRMDKTGANEAYIALVKRLVLQKENKAAMKAAADLWKQATKSGCEYTREAALQIMLSAEPDNRVKLLQKALKDPSRDYRNAALRFASDGADATLYIELMKTMAKAKPEVKVDLLNWLGRECMTPAKHELLKKLEIRFDLTLQQLLVDQLKNPAFEVKQAVVWTLARIGNKGVIPLMADLLKSGDKQVVLLAQDALTAFPGDIDQAVARVIPLAQTDAGKVAGLELLAMRKADANVNTVLEQTRSPQADVKRAAYVALKDVVTEKDLTLLCGMLETAEAATVEPLQLAVVSAVSNMSAAEQVATLSRRMIQAGESKKHLYYNVLATTGEQRALDMIIEGCEQGMGAVKDAAVGALLKWGDLRAADYLYQIAGRNSFHLGTMALKRYIELVSMPERTGERRLIDLRKAMEIASTGELKVMALKQIERAGTFLSLMYASEFLDEPDPGVRSAALYAVWNIARNHPEYAGKQVRALLHRILPMLDGEDARYEQDALKKYLDEMPEGDGFVSLFNGKDLTDWKGWVSDPLVRARMKPAQLAKAQQKADEQMRQDWQVEKGCLVYEGNGFNNICTEKSYADFEMYVDWMLDPAGPEADAGIYLRATPQVQIWDTARVNVGAQVGSGGLYNNKIHQSKPSQVSDNRLGEWNSFYIKMVGDRVTVKLNGDTVVDNVILENYWDCESPVFPMEQIELQAHGSRCSFRNLYIKELKRAEPFRLSAEEEKEGFKVLFDGTNMHEWTGNTVDYTLEDGCISMNPSKSFGGNLYTKKEYANFIYRFDFQLTPGANNGVGIRTPMEGDAAYVGMEIQVLDCEHPIYKDITPLQHHGSVYGIIPARADHPKAFKPAGEWNTEEIMADGDHIRVTVNGVVILDGNIREATKNGTADGLEHPGLFNKKGHIGFLGHGSPVKFRNIRIKELK